MKTSDFAHHAHQLASYVLLGLTIALATWIVHDHLDRPSGPVMMSYSTPAAAAAAAQPEVLDLAVVPPPGTDQAQPAPAQPAHVVTAVAPQPSGVGTLRLVVPAQGRQPSAPGGVQVTGATARVQRPVGHSGRTQPTQPAPGTAGTAPATPTTSYQIVASNGSIVLVGDDGELIANTGHTESSGVVGLGVTGSTIGTGTSTAPPDGTVTTDTTHEPAGNAALAAMLSTGQSGGRSIVLSGMEDHSVTVAGNDQIVTYDDSNVFIARNGAINANTGDTDSSGLNAVDVTGSRVRSGSSGDGESSSGSSEDGEGDETPEPEEISTQDDPGTAASAADDTLPALPPGMSYGTVTDEGASTAVGRDTLAIGADGYDDVSIRSQGNRNTVTYDDSNVVIGGTGPVNAQVGDSDTGGAVVMGVHDSDVEAGCEGDLCHSD